MVPKSRLQLSRGDVLPGGRDDDLLLASHDPDESVLVDPGEVT